MTLEKQLKADRANLLNELARLLELGEIDKVMKTAESMLYENPEDAAGMYYVAQALLSQQHEEAAYIIMQQATMRRSDRPEMWQTLGHIADRLWRHSEALACYFKALELNPVDGKTYSSLASGFVGVGEYKQAIAYAERALELEPEDVVAKVNKGFAHLSLRQWKEGFEGYEWMIGHKSKRRKATFYGPKKFWKKENETVAIYTEQGIGDGLMFSSCIPDALKDAKKVVIDCEPKIRNLLARSFPDADVYGTRHEEAPGWMGEYQFDSSLPIGSLPFLYRKEDSDFPKTPYLKADPERKRMYRALLDGLGSGLKVGISWMGGNSYGGLRKLELDRLKDLVESFPDVHWVNLNYKDADTYGLHIHTWKYATQTNDYDDTAALVDELDLVISVPQSVVHLAGGLGKETLCIVPDVTRWIYGAEGEDHPWYGSVKVIRNWDTNIEQVKEILRAKS